MFYGLSAGCIACWAEIRVWSQPNWTKTAGSLFSKNNQLAARENVLFLNRIWMQPAFHWFSSAMFDRFILTLFSLYFKPKRKDINWKVLLSRQLKPFMTFRSHLTSNSALFFFKRAIFLIAGPTPQGPLYYSTSKTIH